MKRVEAQNILSAQMASFSNYHEVASLVVSTGPARKLTITGESKTDYLVELHFLWDNSPGQNIRIVGIIELEGDLTHSFILTQSLIIKGPDGLSDQPQSITRGL